MLTEYSLVFCDVQVLRSSSYLSQLFLEMPQRSLNKTECYPPAFAGMCILNSNEQFKRRGLEQLRLDQAELVRQLGRLTLFYELAYRFA